MGFPLFEGFSLFTSVSLALDRQDRFLKINRTPERDPLNTTRLTLDRADHCINRRSQKSDRAAYTILHFCEPSLIRLLLLRDTYVKLMPLSTRCAFPLYYVISERGMSLEPTFRQGYFSSPRTAIVTNASILSKRWLQRHSLLNDFS